MKTELDMCDMMCNNIEYDDNEYVLKNVDVYKNLYDYKGIEKEKVNYAMFDGTVYTYDEMINNCDFDYSDVEYQFTIMRLDNNDLGSLLLLMSEWGHSIIIEEPYSWDIIQLPKIIIYDSYIE